MYNLPLNLKYVVNKLQKSYVLPNPPPKSPPTPPRIPPKPPPKHDLEGLLPLLG